MIYFLNGIYYHSEQKFKRDYWTLRNSQGNDNGIISGKRTLKELELKTIEDLKNDDGTWKDITIKLKNGEDMELKPFDPNDRYYKF